MTNYSRYSVYLALERIDATSTERGVYGDGLVQDCSILIGNAQEILQSCIKPPRVTWQNQYPIWDVGISKQKYCQIYV